MANFAVNTQEEGALPQKLADTQPVYSGPPGSGPLLQIPGSADPLSSGFYGMPALGERVVQIGEQSDQKPGMVTNYNPEDLTRLPAGVISFEGGMPIIMDSVRNAIGLGPVLTRIPVAGDELDNLALGAYNPDLSPEDTAEFGVIDGGERGIFPFRRNRWFDVIGKGARFGAVAGVLSACAGPTSPPVNPQPTGGNESNKNTIVAPSPTAKQVIAYPATPVFGPDGTPIPRFK